MKLNVLSLFDGIGCSRLALKKSPNLKVNKYFYSEVDKNCIELLKTKYPDDIYVGAVENIDIKKLPKIDLLIGGSPCQDLSNAHKGDGIGGVRSSLFYQFVKIKNKLKPKYFLLENVKNKWSKLMDKEIGVSGIELNSLYLSGQYRPRVYWSNIEFNEINQDSKNKTIKDYLEKKPDNKYFFNLNLKKINKTNNQKKLKSGINKIFIIPREQLKDNERQRRVYDINGKSPTLLARSDTPKIFINKRIRKLTPLECERLQGLPDNYTSDFSNTTRYKMIGNGFTVQVIKYILSFIGKKTTKKKQLELFH
jgi:site-specific DNA-cytosine methylase